MEPAVESRADLEAALRRELVRHPEVELALLFGSHARDRARSDSDVDVAISAEPFDQLRLIHDLSAATGRTVDVVDLDRAGYFLRVALLRDGIRLYQSDRYAEARWRTRTMLLVETDRPNMERMRDAFLRKTAEAARG